MSLFDLSVERRNVMKKSVILVVAAGLPAYFYWTRHQERGLRR